MTLLLRRRSEVGLIVWVAALAITGSVAVAAADAAAFDRRQVFIPIAFIALMLGLHLFLAWRGVRGDQLLFPLAAGLSAIGLILVQRLQPADQPLLLQQLTWMIVAAGAFAATILIPRDLTALARFKWTWAILGLVLLISPLLPVIGREINRRMGPFPIPPVPYLLPILAMWAMAMVVVIFEKDLGAALLFLGIFLAMLYLATGEAFYTLIGLALLAAGGFAVYQLIGHVHVRIDTWLQPFSEELRFGAGYQIVQGLFALGNAGLFGAGLGNGMPDRIPIVWSDFVFNAFAEETGFAGALILLALYLLFFYRGMLIAVRAPTPFLQLLAGGLSFIVAFQTLVIVGGNARLIPLTGVTLPFVAYGGSSLVTNWMLVALLMRVSDVTARVRGTE
ncbi:MAG: FtsW/RodA/SpoVE family cell cycle protein [Chloroflexi bacterium]|nr:MAG: FtsW/RodA/SpoVE family cell cycle protein [Chloroflexota bacterium]